MTPNPTPPDDSGSPQWATVDESEPRQARGLGVVVVLAGVGVGLSGWLPFMTTEASGETGEIGSLDEYGYNLQGVDLGSIWLGDVPVGRVMLGVAIGLIVAGLVVTLARSRWLAVAGGVASLLLGVGAVVIALYERSEVQSQMTRFTEAMTAALSGQFQGRATVGEDLEMVPASGFALAVIAALVAVAAAIWVIVSLTKPTAQAEPLEPPD